MTHIAPRESLAPTRPSNASHFPNKPLNAISPLGYQGLPPPLYIL